MNLKNYYWYYQKAVPDNVCDNIIKYGLQTKEQMAERLGMGVEDARWDKDTEQFISIESLFPTAAKKKKKKAKGGADDLGL